MRASLPFAISLLALLLPWHQAHGTPSALTAAPDDAKCACAQSLNVAIPYYASIRPQLYAPTEETTFSPLIADSSAPGAATSPFETISTLNRTIVFDHANPGKMSASAGWSSAGGSSVYIGTSAYSETPGSSPGPTVKGLYARYIANTPSLPGVSFAAGPELSGTVRPSGYAATDPGSASDLTIEGFTITAADPGSFGAGSDIAGGTLLLPLTVVGTGPGDLTSNLTIFTHENSALGGGGQTFNDLLDPMVVIGRGEPLPTPEPASIVLVGAGFLALAGVRRRRAPARL